MDMATDHSRWFHQTMYPLYPESTQPVIQPSNGGIPPPIQSYGGNENNHYYNHQDTQPVHSSFHPLCHPSPHSPPTINSSDSNTNCGSRLYLPPNSSSCLSRNSHYNMHSSNQCNNSSSIWQHPINSPPVPLSLPQFQSPYSMKNEDNKGGLSLDASSHYNPDDLKFKLSQNQFQGYSNFPAPLYPPHMSNGDFGGNTFDMLTGLPRCRTGSRSNSGESKYCLRSFIVRLVTV